MISVGTYKGCGALIKTGDNTHDSGGDHLQEISTKITTQEAFKEVFGKYDCGMTDLRDLSLERTGYSTRIVWNFLQMYWSLKLQFGTI